jgi:hypothetical protein
VSGVVEMHVRVTLEPAVVLGLVGIEVVEDDMDGRVRIEGDDVVHEIEEFDASPALLVHGSNLAGGHLEGGDQGRGAVALVVVAAAGQGPPIGKLQIPLGTLQCLDRGLFVDADDDRVLRGVRYRARSRRRPWPRNQDRRSHTRTCARKGRSSGHAENARLAARAHCPVRLQSAVPSSVQIRPAVAAPIPPEYAAPSRRRTSVPDRGVACRQPRQRGKSSFLIPHTAR